MKYKVLKEHIRLDGYMNNVDDISEYDETTRYTQGLLENGFIEELPEKTGWRATGRSNYFRINSKARVIVAPDGTSSGKSDELYNLGNYFKSQETAEKVAESLRLFFRWLHDADSGAAVASFGSDNKLAAELTDAMNEASDAVIEDDRSN